MRTQLQTPAESVAAPAHGVLQRCACGGSSGPTGECAECRRERLLQPKLVVNTPGDRFEQEADRLADRVLRMPDDEAALQRAPLSIQRLPEDTLHRQAEEDEEEEMLQAKAEAGATHAGREAPLLVHDVLRSAGRPLDGETRGFMEQRFGHDFSHVRVHAGGRAAASARSVGARAYTVGRDVVFGTGQYAPATVAGRRLLAHELTHVVQQSAAGLSEVSRSPLSSSAPSGAGVHIVQRTPRAVLQRKFTATCGRHLAETRTGSVCEKPPNANRVGTEVHSHLQEIFERGKNRFTEVVVPYGGKAPCSVFDPAEPVGSIGRLDLVQVTQRSASTVKIKIGEIKPLNVPGLAAGVHDIHNCYADKVREAGANCVSPTNPLDVAFCTKLNALGKTVELHPDVGVHWSPGKFSLTLGRRSRRMVGVRCTAGVLGYRCLGEDDDKKKKKKKKKGAKKATKKTAAKGAKKGAKKSVKKGAKKLAKKFIPGKGYVDAAIVALALLGGAKPSFGMDGMEPDEALYEMITKGTPPDVKISDELQALLDEDPALKEQLSQMAEEQGMPSQEAAQAMIDLLEAHKDQLDEETLQALVTVMEAGSKAEKVPTSEEFKKTLEALKQGAQPGTSEGKTEGEKGQGGGEGTTTTTEPGKDAAPGEGGAGDQPQIDPAVKKKLQEAPPNVRRLYEGLSSKTGVGPKVTAAFIDRFLQLIPSDLSEEQLQGILDRVAPATETTTLDEVLGQLEKALKETGKPGSKDDAAAPTDDATKPTDDAGVKPDAPAPEPKEKPKEKTSVGTPASPTPDAPAPDLQKVLGQLQKQLDGYKKWASIPADSDTAVGAFTQREDGSARQKGDRVPVRVYGRLADGTRFVARATVELKNLDGNKVTYVFRSVTVILFENGKHAPPPAGIIGLEHTTVVE